MHMADALLSPAVGATMLSATAAVTAYSARKVQTRLDNNKIPLMGAMGAFVFAAQMINFAIPATGSSGHLGGGLLLAILLGPHAAFITMASVLSIQALFFADGGLLALGCNIFNLGFLPCYICYPLIYKKITSNGLSRNRITVASIIAALLGLQLGSLSVVLQTYLSGITALPFKSFLLVMQPIHLVIGLVEGTVTAGIVSFMWRARPEILTNGNSLQAEGSPALKRIIAGLLVLAVISGGSLVWLASDKPDGLEWSIAKVAGDRTIEPTSDIHEGLSRLQDKTALLPDYEFKNTETAATHTGTTLSGILGGMIIMACAVLMGFLLKKRPSRTI